jgi:hypothetical protein
VFTLKKRDKTTDIISNEVKREPIPKNRRTPAQAKRKCKNSQQGISGCDFISV